MAGPHPVEVTDATFQAEVEQAPGLVIADFWAVWCGPCRLIAPVLEQLLAEHGARGLKVAKVDVDTNPATAMRFNVRSIPTLIFFKHGAPVDTVIGAVPRAQLADRIGRHL
jgi:thioredoxin 1